VVEVKQQDWIETKNDINYRLERQLTEKESWKQQRSVKYSKIATEICAKGRTNERFNQTSN